MLHVRAKDRMRSGELPTQNPSMSYAGKGSSVPCALCDAPILGSEIEYELVFAGPDAPARKVLRFHCACGRSGTRSVCGSGN
jgi:hypothetical protein